ncbi:MAG: histidine phosphatase family protein [Roseivirga sp.]|uniref:histidine phosphatase family protein n=1 Tax=Roseivirga sp. TaxID=1964215 RepID=UPI001B11BCB1|nr:histidine phosphatase family protein [Roseivirga sp.]MBO6660582.1 histidine phosphatase family protein [Roseivirga sp.]MBO6761444.1 histidine phosphatase family protein [Roseivirga sp.]MBO6906681.1 histidine phosphatase family protein [Roseivirga sp.]
MIKKIYLTRHGQTDYNLKGVVQGSGIDADLNATGRAQANAFYQAYKDHPFDKLYVSGLKRTFQSMEGFINDKLPYEALPDLNEISWGKHEGVPVDQEGAAYYAEMIKRWQLGETDIAIEGGESPNEVAARMQRALEYILAQKNESQVLICMHGRAMRMMLSVMLNYPLKSMDSFEHSNLCLYQLAYTGCSFQLEKYNDTSHLQDLKG